MSDDYYQTLGVARDASQAEIEKAGAVAPPLAEVREQIYELLIERKLNEEIERWLARARERQEVLRFNR